MMYYFGSSKWSPAKLEDLVFFQRGYDITKEQQSDGNFPVISSSGITSYHSEFKVLGPGVIIGRKGSLGTIHYSVNNYWPHDTTLWSKDFHGNNPKFVYYALHCIKLQQFDVGNSNPTINRNHIHDLPIRIPEIVIQDLIAMMLSTYDDLIENNRRRIALLEQSARLLYQEWFVRFRFPGHEKVKIVDGVPEGWKKETASDVMDILSGGTPKTIVPTFWGGIIPFFTPKDSASSIYTFFTEKTLTEKGLQSCNSKLYPTDTIFITARGTVGKMSLAQTPMAMNQSCYALIAKKPLTQYFLFFGLQEKINELQSKASGSVFDAIIRDTFKQIPFMTPTHELIMLFTESITPLLRQTDNLLSQNRKLTAARDLLLPRLMSGEIAV